MRRVMPSASRRSSRSCAGRRPVPSRSRKRASGSSRAAALLDREPGRRVVGVGPDRDAAAEPDEGARFLEPAGERSFVHLGRLEARVCGGSTSRSAVRRARSEIGSRPREHQPRAAALEAEERDDVLGPGSAGIGAPDPVGRAASAQVDLQEVEPRAREDPAACPLETVEIAEPRQRLAGTGSCTSASSSPLSTSRSGRSTRAGRRRIEDDAAAEVAPVAEDDAVAACRDRRRRKPQLRLALAHADDLGRVLGRPVADLDGGPNGARSSERDVEPVGGAEDVLGTRASPRRISRRRGWARRARRAGRPRLARPDGRAPGPCGRAPRRRRAGRPGRPRSTVPDHSVPVTTVPIPRRLNTRSTNRRAGPSAERGSTRSAAAAIAVPSSSSPRPVFALVATMAAPGTSSRASASASSRVSSSTASAFVSATTPSLDAEQAQDREVLVRLGPRALAGVDHEQEEVDAARAGDHRPDEPLVPGDVDERERAPVGQVERRVAEIDRDSALAAPPAAGRCPCPSAR